MLLNFLKNDVEENFEEEKDPEATATYQYNAFMILMFMAVRVTIHFTPNDKVLQNNFILGIYWIANWRMVNFWIERIQTTDFTTQLYLFMTFNNDEIFSNINWNYFFSLVLTAGHF